MIGQRFGNYRAISLLGEGGMGAVYLAEHPSIGRRVAIKVLRKELIGDPQHLVRFVNEARAANAIRHPNIVEILDEGTSERGVPYLVMELLEGESLSTRLQRGRVDLGSALEIARQTASALHAAHRQGIVHRDLKPANLFLAVDGQGHERVKVLDFGIAKLQTARPADQVRTETGQMLGTPTYMSPEQCLGIRHVGPRSDLYSLGVILYEMVCGEPPFRSEAWGALVNMHVNQAPPRPRRQAPDLPAAVEAIILKTLAKNPDERFGSMAELQTALEGAATGAPAVAAPGTVVIPRSSPQSSSSSSPVSGPSTTMSGSTGQREPSRRGATRLGRWLGVALVAAAGATAIHFGRARVDQPETAPAQVGATSAGPTQTPLPPIHPARAMVQLGIETDPPGAQVVRAADGQKLGLTPFRGSFAAGGSTLEVILEREGYEPVRRLLPLSRDQDVVITLSPRRPPRPRPKARISPPAQQESEPEPAKL